MQCPVCKDTKLTMTDRQGIEIDYCPDCRGVWLDRGELDKIVERTRPVATDSHQPAAAFRHGSHKHKHKHKSTYSLLGELFDL